MADVQDIKKLGRYEIHSTLGKGGMATVYKAMDSFLQRVIALKVANVSSLDIAKPDKKKLAQCLREFYNKKIMQLVDANLAMIRAGR